MHFNQDLYKLILDFNKNFDCFYYNFVLWHLHVDWTIYVAFDAMQKLIIIKDIFLNDINEIIISAGLLHVQSILSHLWINRSIPFRYTHLFILVYLNRTNYFYFVNELQSHSA